MKTTALLITLCLLAGCARKAIESEEKGPFELEFLFEKDGCKMYRFYDAGHYVYWSNCEGKSEYNYSRSNGKSRVQMRQEEITNVSEN